MAKGPTQAQTATDMRDAARKVVEEKEGKLPEQEVGGEAVDTEDGKAPVDAFSANLPAIPFKIKRRVTIPTLRFEAGMKIVCQINTPIAEAEALQETSSGRPKMGPAMVCTIEAPDGTLRRLVCGTILQRELERQYANHSYVGLWFFVEKFAPDKGRDKNYATYEIAEIDDPRT